MNACSPRGSTAPILQSDYRLRQLDAADVDEHAQNLSLWQQSYDQLAPGRFTGSLLEFWTPEAQVFLERTSHTVRQHCRVWDDALWFGIPTRHDGTRIAGREAPASALLVQPGGNDFELLTPSDHEIFGVVLRRDALIRHGDAIGVAIDWEKLRGTQWLQTDPASFTRSLALLRQLFATLGDNPALAAHAAARQNFSRSVIALILPFIEGAPAAEPPRAFGRHQHTVAAIDAYARSHPDWVPSVPELCERFHLSRRSLQYAFEDVMGISPLTYLRSLRLNGVRRSLRDPDSGFDNVSEAAAAWGFWHMGQFSQDYRALFGERPSDTYKSAHPPQRGH